MLLELGNSDLFCWAWNRIYLKANGRVPCWCNSGEVHTLNNFTLNKDFVADIVNGPSMRQMRLMINGVGLPYISECRKCCCLTVQNQSADQRYLDSETSTETKGNASSAILYMKHVEKVRNWPIGSIDQISEIQIEPSLPCNLSCPGCPQRDKEKLLKSEGPPYILDIALFQKMINDSLKHNVTINRIQYCGKGEPTLNKNLPLMIKYAYDHKIPQSMDTNATHELKDEYLLLDRINCSIDGSDEQSYLTYRRGGDFQKAINFMTTAAQVKASTGSNCQIRWKYILFDTTEDEHKLDKAQELAKKIGIDQLDFVITSCGAYDGSVKPTSRFKILDNLRNYINNNRIFDNTIASRS